MEEWLRGALAWCPVVYTFVCILVSVPYNIYFVSEMEVWFVVAGWIHFSRIFVSRALIPASLSCVDYPTLTDPALFFFFFFGVSEYFDS